jgi:hypothetical protein
MTWRTFFRLIQRRRIIDSLAALLAGKGIDYQVRGTHQALLYGRRGLEGQQFVHQGGVEATTKLGKYLGEHEVPLGALDPDLPNPARIHHRQVGPQLATDLLIGTVQLMFE